MRKVMASLIIAVSCFACTPRQQAVFWQAWHRAHPNFCTEDDRLWNGHDHRCETPAQFCKSKYGPDARPHEDKNGDIGCYRIGTAIHKVVR